MNIAENIKRLMAQRCWKPINLVVELDARGNATTIQTVERWLDGGSLPRADTLPVIAEVFGVAIDELYAEAEQAAP